MTEEIIKECKNCDALGIDSEIGVYYCCLSHRQDDLPKKFTCEDFILNKQLLRLEQENKELKEKFKQVFNIDNQECWNIAFLNDEKYKYRAALEEIKKYIVDELCGYYHSKKDDYNEILEKIESIIEEVLND